MRNAGGNGVIVTQRSVTEEGEFESLVTLCLRLLRLSAGRGLGRVATFEIPEVLIGEVDPRLTDTLYTSLRSYAGFFLLVVQHVTAREKIHTWLHFGSFPCFFALVKSRARSHNQDPRGIDW
ncbi:hypothetical protein DVA44_04500 [Leclercia sp. W17]|nr:hypothetical protein DVA44_04500 [Leclercia sp. W17]